MSHSSFLEFISDKRFWYSFLCFSISENVLLISDFNNRFSSNSDIVSEISSLIAFFRFSKFSLFISNVFISSRFSYFKSVFSSTFFFFSSIFVSSTVNLEVISARAFSFSSSSLTNFSLLLDKFVFFSNLDFFSSSNSKILVFKSSISDLYLPKFELLFEILSLATLILELICSICLLLSKPKFWALSIESVSSSNSSFKFCFRPWRTFCLFSSACLWDIKISVSFTIASIFSL